MEMDHSSSSLFAAVILGGTLGVLIYLYVVARRVGPDNPLLYVIYSLVTACFLQAVAMIYAPSDLIIDTITVREKTGRMPMAAWIVTAFFLCFCIASCASLRLRLGPVKNNEPSLVRLKVHRNRILVLSIAIGALVFGALILFAKLTGTTLPQLLVSSEKRLVMNSDGPSAFENYGSVRNVAKLGMPIFLFLVALFIHRNRKPTLVWWIVLITLGVLAFLPAFALSNRGAVAYAGICIMLMLLIRRRLNFGKMAILGGVGLVAFSLMSSFRFGVSLLENPFIGFQSYFYYGGGNSIFNNTMISNYVLNGGELKKGESYIGSLVFPIPRAIWRDKPLIALDEFNAYDVYNIRQGFGAQAIPAGLVGELLLNFGILSIPFFAVIIALIVTAFYKTSLNLNRPFLSFILRTVIFPRFILKLIGSGLGFAIMEAFIVGVPILLIYWICVREDRYRSSALGFRS